MTKSRLFQQKPNMNYKTIIFDFDGVLCQDLFYANLKESYPEVFNFIETKVFCKGSNIPDRWMKAQMNTDDVNHFISNNINIDFKTLSNLFIQSVKDMSLEKRLLNLARRLMEKNKNVAIVTNNVDVFNTISVRNHKLDEIFPVIVNSFDYGFMKHELNGKLFDIAFDKLGVHNYREALLIDDSSKARAVFESKGGTTFPYETYEIFEPWMKNNLLTELID